MSIMDELKKLTRPYDDDGLEDDGMDVVDDVPSEPSYARAAAPAPTPTQAPMMQPVVDPRPKVVSEPFRPIQSTPNVVTSHSDIAKYRVVLIKPEDFSSATEIANNIRQGHAVILNCEDTDQPIARRVVDFLSGCAYALDGSIKKAANSVYIITPPDVNVLDEKQEDTNDGLNI